MSTASPSRRALRVLGLTLLVMFLNISATVLYMVLYGHVLAPGHDDAYYEAHVQVAAPWSSIVVGIPLMFFAARWLARRTGTRDGIWVAFVYVALDLVIVLGSGALGRLAPFVIASHATKLAAAWVGANAGARRASREQSRS